MSRFHSHPIHRELVTYVTYSPCNMGTVVKIYEKSGMTLIEKIFHDRDYPTTARKDYDITCWINEQHIAYDSWEGVCHK